MLGGELGDQVGGQRRRVPERLVGRARDLGQQLGGVGRTTELVVLGPVAARDQPRLLELVEGALLEADRERLHPPAALLGGQRGQRGGVDAAREQHAHRDVGDQVRADGVAQPLAQLGGEHASRSRRSAPAGTGTGRAQRRSSTRSPPASQLSQWPGGSLRTLAEDRQRRRGSS